MPYCANLFSFRLLCLGFFIAQLRHVLGRPARNLTLLGTFERKSVSLDIARDARRRADDGAFTDGHGSNQHGIASDEYVVSDNRGMLAHTVVVAGDGTRANIDARSHGGIADIRKVRNLAAGTDGRFLNLHMRARLGSLAQMGARAQVCAGAGRRAIIETRVFGNRLVNAAAAAHHGIRKARIRTDNAIATDGSLSHQKRHGQQFDIVFHLDVGADPYRGRIPHGNAGGHVTLVDAMLHGNTCLSKFRAHR